VKKLIVTLGAVALFAVPAAAGSASNGSGDGYGNAIQECFGMNYGQAKNFAWEAGHASKPALGAKLTAIAHGCDA
jgi:hypothetical protein